MRKSSADYCQAASIFIEKSLGSGKVEKSDSKDKCEINETMNRKTICKYSNKIKPASLHRSIK